MKKKNGLQFNKTYDDAAMKDRYKYTTGGSKYPKPTWKLKPKKNGLSIEMKF